MHGESTAAERRLVSILRCKRLSRRSRAVDTKESDAGRPISIGSSSSSISSRTIAIVGTARRRRTLVLVLSGPASLPHTVDIYDRDRRLPSKRISAQRVNWCVAILSDRLVPKQTAIMTICHHNEAEAITMLL